MQRYCHAICCVMQTSYIMTAADKAELASIEADQATAKLRRKRFFAKLRQRAHRAKRMERDNTQ
jgi:hypothetical protein